jgi:hypothetical protein
LALAHRSPIDAKPQFRRARLRQRVADATPRAIPDAMWDELLAAMSCDRDRALLLCYVASGARASELLGVMVGDVDWAGSRVYVISKGTRLRQAVPVSPEAMFYLTRYLDAADLPGPDEPLWRTRRGEARPVSYWAMRRVLQRANEKLGTNWSLHDVRHTAATRMANDPDMTLSDVQAVLRHANIETTGRYLTVRVGTCSTSSRSTTTGPARSAPTPPGTPRRMSRRCSVADRYTLRNRRSPALKARDAERERRSRFAIDAVQPAPGQSTTPPRPFGNLSRASIDELVGLAGDKLGSQLDSPRAKRRSGTRHLLEHLAGFAGRTWQDRWLDSGLDTGRRPVSDLDPDKYRGYNLTHGLKALLCLRVITPSLSAFRATSSTSTRTRSARHRRTRC